MLLEVEAMKHIFLLILPFKLEQPGDLEKAQLGLGHSYSRAKVKFNVNRVDNMVIQAIFILDTLDKDVNSFSMRVRLVYSFNLTAYCFLVISNNENYPPRRFPNV